MRNYIIKRVAQSVLILFCVMFIIYALIRSLPSSFAETMAMQLAQAPGAKPYEEWLAQLNASYGLDLDIVPGFFTWLSKAVVGNFGDSWKWNVPATQKFTEVIGLSVIMGGISFVLYGMISAVGVRNVVENNVDFTKSRNVLVAAMIMGLAVGVTYNGSIVIPVGDVTISLSGLAVAALVGILMNAVLPGKDYEFGTNEQGDTSVNFGTRAE